MTWAQREKEEIKNDITNSNSSSSSSDKEEEDENKEQLEFLNSNKL